VVHPVTRASLEICKVVALLKACSVEWRLADLILSGSLFKELSPIYGLLRVLILMINYQRLILINSPKQMNLKSIEYI